MMTRYGVKTMDDRAAIGGNNPPDPLDEALAPYGDFISEAETWLDGQAVTDESAMKAVDALAKEIKAAKKDVTGAQKSESAPLHDKWKAALARYKPTIDDLDRMAKGLVGLNDAFKRKMAEEKREAERKAWQEAEAARKIAEEAAEKADATNIEEQRAAEAAKREAMEAEKAAQAAKRDTKSVKGLRTVHMHEVNDMRALVNWIAVNDKDAMAAFATEYARKHHRDKNMAGVSTWTEKEAF